MVTVDLKKLGIRKGYRILDIGCGSGRHTCAAYGFEKVMAIGVDLSATELSAAKQRLQLHDKWGQNGGGGWGLTMADISALPFDDNYFDLVICAEVLEHIADDHQAAGEIIRVLKSGHNLAVSVPRFWPERICWALSTAYTQTDNGHIRIYRKKNLIALLESFGTECWYSHYAHSLHTPYWWLKCLLGPDRSDLATVNLYHRFLTWDIIKQPHLVAWIDKLLNPILGKSLVVYFRKKG